MSEIDAKKFYNEVMPTKQGEDYEHARWHKDKIAEVGYQQTLETVNHFLNENHPATNILELGPGAGTWSCLLRKQYPETPMTLVDISKEMLNRTEKVLGADSVQYVESSFTDFQTQKSFDLFFSSRVVEYIEDKPLFARHLYSLLREGSHGMIITKMPQYGRMKLIGKKVSRFHTEQVKPNIFAGQLREAGLHVVSVKPVTVSVPLCKSSFLNRVVGKVIRMLPINVITSHFIESYVVVFKK